MLQQIQKLEIESKYFQNKLNKSQEYAKEKTTELNVMTEKYNSVTEEKKKVRSKI